MASRAILIKCVYELWTTAASLDELADNLKQLDPAYVHRCVPLHLERVCWLWGRLIQSRASLLIWHGGTGSPARRTPGA